MFSAFIAETNEQRNIESDSEQHLHCVSLVVFDPETNAGRVVRSTSAAYIARYMPAFATTPENALFDTLFLAHKASTPVNHTIIEHECADRCWGYIDSDDLVDVYDEWSSIVLPSWACTLQDAMQLCVYKINDNYKYATLVSDGRRLDCVSLNAYRLDKECWDADDDVCRRACILNYLHVGAIMFRAPPGVASVRVLLE